MYCIKSLEESYILIFIYKRDPNEQYTFTSSFWNSVLLPMAFPMIYRFNMVTFTQIWKICFISLIFLFLLNIDLLKFKSIHCSQYCLVIYMPETYTIDADWWKLWIESKISRYYWISDLKMNCNRDNVYGKIKSWWKNKRKVFFLPLYV